MIAAVLGCSTDVRDGSDGLDMAEDTGGGEEGGGGPLDGGVESGSGGTDGSGGSSSLPNVNGCTYATAQDFTSTALTVSFPSLAYAPKCARIRAGQAVKFNGAFADHPLVAGRVASGVATPAVGSPIVSTSSGTMATFTFPTSGAFPYYCNFHYAAGMVGAIYVDP
jgi:plastocyanin